MASLTFISFDRHLSSASRITDLHDITFIDAYGLVGLALTVMDAIKKGEELDIYAPDNEQLNGHMDRMGFGEVMDEIGAGGTRRARKVIDDRPDVVVPLHLMRKEADVQPLADILFTQLRRHADSQVLNAISEGLYELTNNSFEHSGGAPAVGMAQVYTRGQAPDHENTVQLVIGDVGCGVRESFLSRGAYHPSSDADALALSLEYLVSSVPEEEDPGRGQGLATADEEATGLQGSFSIRSGTARVLHRAGSEPVTMDVPYLKGTIVGLVIPLRPGAT